MSQYILKSFASTAWSKDPYLTREMRSIFNNCMAPPFQNKGVFGKDLVFDENANLITRILSEKIIRSFANDPWDADDPLLQGLRDIFNNEMNRTIPPGEIDYFDADNLKFDPNANKI